MNGLENSCGSVSQALAPRILWGKHRIRQSSMLLLRIGVQITIRSSLIHKHSNN